MGVIYKITNTITEKSYIGQTKHTAQYRWRQHIWESKHPDANQSRKLNNAIIKYGEDLFEITTLLICDDIDLDEKEIEYIAQYDTFNNGYNLTSGGKSPKYLSAGTIEKLKQKRGPATVKVERKRTEDNILPKYLKHYISGKSEGYRIGDHPSLNGTSKSFTKMDQTMDDKLNQALEFLKKLNDQNNELIIEKKKEPKGVQPIPNGYRVRITGFPVKTFQNSKLSMEDKLKLATDYANNIYNINGE